MGSKIKSSIDLNKLVRENVKKLVPYSSARDEFTGKGSVFLDANENPYENGVNRYPDPLQRALKVRLGDLKDVNPENMILGNGSDEVIDLLYRVFCEPNIDNVIICTPTYGMYEVAAGVNAVGIKEVQLDANFQPDVDAVLSSADDNTKMLFLCSPNNPTANLLDESKILELLDKFQGIVIVDEAYIDFAPGKTLVDKLTDYPNLVILQTLSKAWGMAGIRLGIGLASKEIIDVLNRIKPPYNVNCLTQTKAFELLEAVDDCNEQVSTIVKERDLLSTFLSGLSFVEKVYPSDANFILVRVNDAKGLYNYLLADEIIIRDRSKIITLEGCVRISVGTSEENEILKNTLTKFESKS
ncbi:histidinol-phosphate transaminase [Labilibaculum antarcticum]|uniref:Histidinol-phosphate aminotransferase n=1 Tax=Labilibaculum antarcticum TaxID=1717717 RepID=A0A1Y1CER5_9BACT|nr:histidinol-phosphate transaminase [Labilibaculum antarcticum]BAX78603.1 histidinol-phosphate transaminase [Labilibaculum antarcticum]